MGRIILHVAAEEHPDTADRGERGVDRLLQATSALADTLGSASLQPVAAATAQQAKRLVSARALLLMLEDAGCLMVAATAGETPAGAQALREPIDGAAWRRVMLEHRPERVAGVSGRLAAALERIGVDGERRPASCR